MPFSRSSVPIRCQYYLNDTPLDALSSSMDLDVLFVNKLSFEKHIKFIIFNANSMVGFDRRQLKGCCDLYAFIVVYYSFTRRKLEYGLIVWSPHQSTFIQNIEWEQNRFVRLTVSRPGWSTDLSLRQITYLINLSWVWVPKKIWRGDLVLQLFHR